MQIAVPEGLTVRVINNISKQAEVKQRFYDAFKNEGYPESFPFDQKVCSFPWHQILSLLLLQILIYQQTCHCR